MCAPVVPPPPPIPDTFFGRRGGGRAARDVGEFWKWEELRRHYILQAAGEKEGKGDIGSRGSS